MKCLQNYQKALKLLICLLLALSLTGCGSAVELNKRVFVKMIILDKTKKGIELTLNSPLPNRLIPGRVAGGQLGKPYNFVKREGKDISDAFRKIQSDLSREISLGQTDVVIIGRELAEEGIDPVLEFLERNSSFHINSNLFVTAGKATEILHFPVIYERFPSDIIKAYANEHATVATTIKDFLMAKYSVGSVMAPLLKFGNTTEEFEKKRWMRNDGAAIFKRGKLTTTTNTKEMKGGLLILNQWENKEIGIPSPTDGKIVNFSIRKVHTKIKPIVKGDEIVVHIQSKADASVLASNSNINLENTKHLKLLEKKLDAEVEKLINQSIERTREAKADAFGFGNYISWKYPHKWNDLKQNWEDIYSNDIKITVQVNSSVKSLGAERGTLIKRKGSVK
ncbi:Ger(x)C family spore germination protein [Lederbergia citrea]|uniref:Ger(X)C family spore germination protein n=1 Tax=Lederbergia citrea TaxID=2833581 RepID=A0A942Z6E0_9BACI|nr:Ger(x)C family spore germination protein [Lederbergia citrea]MBS4178760.1 Ger(x)C family spore germination protein [Lederbergia citrea]MBS4224217.1 Ger(x)C family spore germination protein [Lederbergia citrea]